MLKDMIKYYYCLKETIIFERNYLRVTKALLSDAA